jgi:hypothetical protein
MQATNFTHKHYTRLEWIARDNHSSLLRALVNYRRKKSYYTDSRLEIESKIRTVRSKATALLSQWVNLQEVFKIPKKEMFSLRTKHEAEVDRAAAAANEVTKVETSKVRPSPKPAVSQSGYDRGMSSI